MNSRIPLVDLTAVSQSVQHREETVETIRKACEDTGFLVVTGHGVPKEAIESVEVASREFFSLPHQEKMGYIGGPGVFRGYTPIETSTLALSRDIVTPPDLCEAFSINRFDDHEVALRSGLR